MTTYKVDACPARLGGAPEGLKCTRTDAHTPHRGCRYESTSGCKRAPKEEG